MVTCGPGAPANTCTFPSASITLSVPTRTNDLSMCDRGNIEDLLRGALRACLPRRRRDFHLRLLVIPGPRAARSPEPITTNLSPQTEAVGRHRRRRWLWV